MNQKEMSWTTLYRVDQITFVLYNSDTLCFSGLPSPCVYVLAVDGTDGETLWESPLAPDFHWAQCGPEDGPPWDCCLLSHGDRLTAVHKYTGW